MANSLIGPILLVPIAFMAAPLPRPPQPTSATWISSLPAAWTAGTVAPVNADIAARPPVAFRNCRREVSGVSLRFMSDRYSSAEALHGFVMAQEMTRRFEQVRSPEAALPLQLSIETGFL